MTGSIHIGKMLSNMRAVMTGRQKQILVVYGLLLLSCGALLLISNALDPAARSILLPTASDGFKMVLAAFIGALSTMLGDRRQP